MNLVNLEKVPLLQVDNFPAVSLAQNPELHRNTKHIAIKHFFREKVTEGKIDIEHISPSKLFINV